MLSPLDDYPVHQVAETMRHVGTSDRNFYDRYYFNLHHCSDELFLVAGMGQYPNLGVADAFVVVLKDGVHRVVRASRELGVDRMDTRVGPIAIDVIEGLHRLRVTCGPNDHGIEMDLEWQGSCPAYEEPRHFQRQFERVTFDTMRLAQNGRWRGSLVMDGEAIDVTPDRWWGARDRSWGVRPVGEPEPPGIRASRPPGGFFWNYAPMQFDDFSILYIVQEQSDGTRVLEEAVRLWPDGVGRPPEPLGVPVHDLEFVPGTRDLRRATIHLTEPGGRRLEISAEPLLALHVGVGTGYGGDADWRHGMYQGALEVSGVCLDLRDQAVSSTMRGLVDNVARFEVDGQVGYGMFEILVAGPHERYGFKTWEDVA